MFLPSRKVKVTSLRKVTVNLISFLKYKFNLFHANWQYFTKNMTYQLAGFAFGCLNLIINRPSPTGCPSSTTWFLRLSCFCCAFEMSEPPLSPFFLQTYRDNNVSTNVAHFNAIIVVRSHPFITTAPVYASFDDISIVIIQWNSFWSVPSCHCILFFVKWLEYLTL